jgi:hypothetical protein
MNNYIFPITLLKYDIYDIFYSNEHIIIISPAEKNPNQISLLNNDKLYAFDLLIDPHNHTYIYKLNHGYKNTITLSINNELIESKINKYCNYENKILMSTIVKDEDEYVLHWIKYHKILGVDNFIIYDNSNNNTLNNVLDEYVTKGVVLLIKWTYPYILSISGISGQTTQQNHSIYAFRDAKYIGMFDIDEYVNPQDNYTNIKNLFEEYINNNNINITEIGSFTLLNKLFYNPNELSTKNFNFLKIYNCDDITRSGREKNFVIPKNVDTFSVHIITSGKVMHYMHSHLIYFNHYFYLNKNNRGKNKTNLLDYSIKNKVDLIDTDNKTN